MLFLSHEGGMYGAQQSLALLIEHLDPADITPIVSVARTPDGPFAQAMHALPNVQAVLTHQRVQWVKHSQRNLFQKMGDSLGLLWQAITRVPKLAKLIRDHRIDLVHTNSVVSLEGALAAKLAGVPHVWHCREMFTVTNPKFQPMVPVNWVAPVMLALSDHIICITDAVKAQFPKANQAKCAVVWNPVVIDSKKLDREPIELERCRLGYVGRLSTGKGVLTVLEALADGRKQYPHWTLHLFGHFINGEEEQRITQRIKMLGLDEAVVFHGFCEGKAEIYRNMDVLVLPSTNEAFGRVLVEAMSFGVSCVGSDAAAIPEVLVPVFGENSVFAPNDGQACMQAIEKIVQQPFPATAVMALLKKVSPTNASQAVKQLYDGCIS